MLSIPLRHFFLGTRKVNGKVGKYTIEYFSPTPPNSIRRPHSGFVRIDGDVSSKELREIADILDQLIPPPVEKSPWEVCCCGAATDMPTKSEC